MSEEEKELLVSRFKDVTGTSDERARFYLDSSNWTLQLALSSFYENQLEDIESQSVAGMSSGSPVNTNSSESTMPEVYSSSKPESSNWLEKKNKPKVTTLHNMTQQISDDEEGQAFYAGGSERSGQQVIGPPKRKSFQEQLTDMFKIAQENGAIVDSNARTSSSRDQSGWGIGLRLGQTEHDLKVENPSAAGQSANPVILKLWRQGFSINDGELKLYDDPDNKEFLDNVMKGLVPNELRQIGNIVSVDVEDRRHEDFKRTEKKTKSFKGSGHTLGSPAPETYNTIATMEQPSVNQPSSGETEIKNPQPINVNQNEPSTMLQIRLSDGSRLSGQFNLSHTINDVRQYIINSRPQYADQNFVLVTSFPTKELTEGSDSIDKAGLKNASLLQRLI